MTGAEIFQRICDLLKLKRGAAEAAEQAASMLAIRREKQRAAARRRQLAAERKERERERETGEGEEEFSDAMEEEWGKEEGSEDGSEDGDLEGFDGPETPFELTRAMALAMTDEEQLVLELTWELTSPVRKLQVSSVLVRHSTVCILLH